MTNRRISIFLSLLLFAAQFMATGFVAANELFPTPSQTTNSSAANPSLRNSPINLAPIEFLPVEKAYQLKAEVIEGQTENQQLFFQWTLQPGYYLYQHGFKFFNHDSSRLKLPTEAMPTFEPGKRIYDEFYERELEVYYHQTSFSIPLNVVISNSPLTENSANPTELMVESQACADAGLCYPPRRQLLTINRSPTNNTHSVTVTEANNLGATTNNTKLPPSTQPLLISSLLLMLLFALLGGAILNLMPCVFPVLSIKALSLTTYHLSKHGKHLHGLAYTLGIVLSFLAIAILLMSLRRAGESIGWGFQLQSPVFIGVLAYLFVVMGLGFSGLLNFGASLMNWGQSTTQGHSLSASFMTGLLATLVASPCTAPFMGTALGFALTQPTWIALITFACLGLGMALPLLILSWWPGLAEKMPKPGPWMERFKEFLAFPLYLTAVWLLWVLGRQAGSDTVAAVICGVVLILFALWLLKGQKSRKLRAIIAFVAFVIALLLPWQTQNNAGNTDQPWQPYSQQTLEQLLGQQQAVFINLTADWCITCLANEKLALSSDEFLNTLKANNITYLKGDWTNYNPEITELLNQHQRSGVPLYLFYSKGSDNPVILPQLLTEKIVIKAISMQN